MVRKTMSYDPIDPDFACPTIDSAIEDLETVRTICAKLRDNSNHWESHCLELRMDNEELKNRVAELEAEIKES